MPEKFSDIYLFHEIRIWCVQTLIIIILGILVGLFMKLADDISDTKSICHYLAQASILLLVFINGIKLV
jgi:hypothetical protein